ncbi:MAG: DUF2062 domain-containing protein [Verrucomicrobia bacterium]|nr:DUF2062 domain-containing protein [Verrucomicrobiota bacterium]
MYPATTTTSAARPGYWRRRVSEPIRRQLTQGADPAGLARAIAVGGVIAVNPFLGTTTLGCALAGAVLRLNQPMLQVVNILGGPLQLLLIVPWVRAGEWLYGARRMPIDPATLAREFAAGPGAFLRRFGETGLHAATAWLIAAPVLGFGLFFATRRPLQTLARRLTPQTSP